MRRIGLFIILQLAIVSAAHAQANTISTYAGGGTNSTTATTAHLPQTYRAVRDTSGNTYISVPSLGTVYKVNGSGTMSIYAGTGVLGFFGDGGPAASAQLDYPLGMALDSAGNLYIADSQNNRIRKVTASSGVITTVAGSGDEYNGAGFFGGYSGDGGSATDALLNGPTDVAVDGSGNFYISDVGNQVVRQVNGGTGTITTYAGTGNAGFSGDGGPATSAKFRQPNGVTLDLSGNLFISDKNNCIVRRVDATTKIITTYAGTPQVCGFSGDSGAATSAELSTPVGVYADAAGFLFIADFGNNRIRKVDNTTAHDISTVAGTGVACTTPTGCGDGGAATSALLNAPKGIFEDASNVLLIADTNDMRVRTVTSGNIANYAGSGNGGNGGPATSGMLSLPYIPNVDGSGNLFILDSFGARIQRVDAVTKNVTTFAGNGVLGVVGATNGDGGQATAASLNYPIAIAFDSTGNIYVADQREFVVRKITLATGVITTIAGNRQQCGSGGSNPNTFPACGDEGAATSASLCIPVGVALDANNNVFISDQCLSRIREVSAGTGVISNYAGDPNNNTGYSGDNGPPTSALMNGPLGIAFSPAGDLYIADTSNNVIREVNTVENIITTYAFNGEPTFGGDGGSASGASMYNPTEIAFDAAGNLFVGGGSDNVVRRIDVNDQTVATVAGNVDNLDGGFFGDGGPSTLALLSNFGLTVDANENLFIADAGNNRIRKVHMVPVASWAPTTLTAFPTLLAGQVSDSQIITFSNTGLNDLTVSVTSISPDFSVSNFCTFEVASPQGSCDLFVSFTPPAGVGAGPVSGSLVLATNDPNNPTVTYPLSGTIASTGFALTVLVVSPAGNVASVSSDPSGISGCGQTGGICTASFASGTVVTLIAGVSSSNPGYAFLGWSGNCTPVVDVPFECTTTVSQVETVTATFGASTLTVSAYGNGSGTITSSPAGINCGATCTFTFPAGTQTVTLTATPNTGSVFVGWEDYYCTSSTGNTCIISLTNYYFSEVAAAVFSVARVPFTKGDVFLGTTGGMIFEYHPSGTLVQVLPPLNSTYFGGFVYGMTFDANGTLYAADPFYDFQNPTAGMETFKFDGTGPTAFGGLSTASAGSVRVDPSGNVFVGLEVNSTTGNLIEFAPGNTTAPSAFYFPAYYQTNGIFAFDIAQDDVTMLYDLGTNSLFSYNIALGLQNPDLTDSLPGTYSGDLRQLPDGTILLADGDRVVRLNSTTGAVIQTYQPAVFSFVLGLTLDGDGVDFWTDDSITGVVYKINIASGAIVTQFNTQLGQSTFGGLVGLGGIAEYGSPASGGEDLSVALAGTGTGSVSSNVAGITCPTACTANYAVGQQVTLTATPAGGSTFAGWSGNCTGTGTCTVTMSAAQAVTATFNTNVTFQFTYIAAGTGTGTVTSSPTGINCTATCTANFASGTVVTLTQTPASGSTFGGWSGACSGTGSCVVTMTSAESVTATFTLSTFPLTVSTAGTGTGTVTSSPSGISCPSTCSANFNSESLVTLTATPVAGSTFAGWSGACNGTGTCPVTMDGAQSVTATFNTTTNVNLTVVLNGTAYGTVTGGAISCSDISGITTGTCTTSVASGTVVTLFEQIGSGSAFGGWSGGGCSGTASSCAVTVTAATTVTATFNNGTGTFLLTVQPSTPSGGQGNGTGTVTSNIGGINCTMANGVVTGGTCTANIASGAIVTLTATPAAGSVFSFWGTDCFGTSTCALTMSAAHTATTTFTALNFALTVSELGTGAGTVTSNPTGINCPTTCTANYASGTAVTLTAAAGANSVFAGWSGQGCTGTGVCTVTVNAAETVTATFNPTSVLTVTEVGTGTGTVSSNPAGILCPSTCAASFTTGAQVTLTATPNSGTTFAGWSGAGCSGVGVCTVTMSAAESVTATFNLPTFALTVTDAGTGSGSVTSNPSGITCPSTCSANYNSGTSVTLTAAAGSGSTFAGWSGACTGTGTCSVTMTAAKSVTATFNTTQFTLTVTKAGSGAGTVTSSPTGINCGTGCTANFNSGTQVTLTAAPSAGSTFAGWSGACTGTGTCVVTMNAAESATATFNTTVNFTLTVTDAGTGTGTVTSQGGLSPAIDCVTGTGTGCSASYASGTTVILTATPGTNSVFAGWSGAACTAGTGTCTVTMNAAESVTATFNSTVGTMRSAVVPFTDDGAGNVTITWSPAFADTNYTAVCTAETTGDFVLPVITSRTASSMTVIPTDGGATPGNLDCIAIPDSDTSDIRHGRTPFSDGQSLITVAWGTAFPDTNYTVACTLESEGLDGGLTSVISDVETGFVTVDNSNFLTGTMHCIAVPDTDTSSVRHGRTTLDASEFPTTVTVPWTTAFPDGNYAAVCSNVELDVTSTDASVAIEPGTKLAASVTLVNEIPSGEFHCLGVGVPPPQFTVTVSPQGAGTGSVVSTPAGINCPGTCSASFTSGTQVTLTPEASGGSTFAGWSDDTCAQSGTAPCSFTVNGSVTVDPIFNVQTFTLTVSLAGTGSGSVTSEPQGINCGSGCSGIFTGGTTVTLFASPTTGSVFAGWSGACSGTGSCVVTMNAAESVTATFNLPPPSFPLTVTIGQPSSSGAGGTGTVTSSPSGIDCPDACSASYVSGTVVTLTATPGSGSAFAGWSGAGCSGTGTCVVTMNAAESVVATFNTSTFTFGVGPGFSTSVNTTPGGNIVVGFTLSSTTPTTVGLGCTSSAPQYLTCLITPTEVSLNGNGPSQVAIVLTSYCQGSTPGMPDGPTPGIPGGVVGVMLLGMALCGAAWSYRGRRRVALSFAILLFAVVGGSACGNLPKGTAGATPPGLYTLSITATVAGQAPQLIQLQVNVQ
jgi:hypothetical protein